jgi:hypothetical protein
VNDICALPKTLVSRAIPELPRTDYYLFHRPGRLRGASARLAETIVAETARRRP